MPAIAGTEPADAASTEAAKSTQAEAVKSTDAEATKQDNSDSPQITFFEDFDGTKKRAILLPNGTYVLANGTQCTKGDEYTICHAPVIDGHQPRYQCGSGGGDFSPETYDLYNASNFSKDFLHWTTEDSILIFGYDDAVWTASFNDHSISKLVDASPPIGAGTPSGLTYGFYADASPNGRQIVYSSCEYETEYSKIWLRENPEYTHPDNIGTPHYVRGKRDYELATIDIDGSRSQRLTVHRGLDLFPAWSPDGKRLAFISNQDQGEPLSARSKNEYRQFLYTMATDGSDIRRIVSGRVALSPPVWSPDGRFLAIVTIQGQQWPYGYSLRTVRSDGSKVHTIGEIHPFEMDHEYFPLPSWSPDGNRIAFVTGEASLRSIYTALPDGTDEQLVVEGVDVRQIAWSPDGSEILYVADWVYLVDPDGSNLRRLEVPAEVGWRMADAGSTALAAWSPDGSMIAIHYPGRLLVAMNRDGTHHRILYEGDLRPRSALPTKEPVYPTICSTGLVVPEPEANPGLVKDCDILLTVIEALAGDSPFRWSSDLPITSWEGVDIQGSPLRVRGLWLTYQELTGSIPPELGDLHALDYLNVAHNRLTGEIPPELGRLANLEQLDLSGNQLTGAIPSALGDLTALQELDLSNTELSGTFPLELANLTELRFVDFSNTWLAVTGCISSEFSDIWVTGSGLDRCEDGG